MQNLSFLLSFCSLNINLSVGGTGWLDTYRKLVKFIHKKRLL
jgi:hypothetical protein